MLKKKYRLNLAKKENSEIFNTSNSTVLKSENFLLYGRDNQTHLQLTVVTPKRLFKTAVSRTKNRSLLYSLVEVIMDEEKIDISMKKDLVIVCRNKISLNKREDLKVELSQLIAKFLKN